MRFVCNYSAKVLFSWYNLFMAKEKAQNVLFIGDISTRAGRQTIKRLLPGVRRKHEIGLVIANAENAAGGKGVTREIISELQSYGVDYFTAGEHVWDIKDFRKDMADEGLPLIRPYNYELQSELPGKGWDILDFGSRRVILACLLGTVFMRRGGRHPLVAFDELYEEIEKRVGRKELEDTPILVDFHAEATAEKRIFAWYVRDRVAAVLGTHTHVGTVDTMLFERSSDNGKCAYVSDVGMCGPEMASLWVDFDTAVQNTKYPFKQNFKVAKSMTNIFNSVLVKIEKNSAKSIERIDLRV